MRKLTPLPLEAWRPTLQTLHRCVQIVGKVQLELTPRLNHFWNVAFEVGPCGLRTPAMPSGDRSFSVEFDFVEHNLIVRTSDDHMRALALVPRPVADFYRDFMEVLEALSIRVSIREQPVEIPGETLPFSLDRQHAAYDPEPVERWWRIVSQSARVLEEFRTRFVGKCSPVQFYWGSFDLALSRFSGRPAPPRPGASQVERESYSHEVSSAGFWPGDARYPAPAYYAYTVPAARALADAPVRPAEAFWHREMGEFLLPYDAVRRAASPRDMLLEFLQSTYEAGADLAGWDRAALEREERAETSEPSVGETASHPPPA